MRSQRQTAAIVLEDNNEHNIEIDSLLEVYKKLSEKCDTTINKINNRKNKKSVK